MTTVVIDQESFLCGTCGNPLRVMTEATTNPTVVKCIINDCVMYNVLLDVPLQTIDVTPHEG